MILSPIHGVFCIDLAQGGGRRRSIIRDCTNRVGIEKYKGGMSQSTMAEILKIVSVQLALSQCREAKKGENFLQPRQEMEIMPPAPVTRSPNGDLGRARHVESSSSNIEGRCWGAQYLWALAAEYLVDAGQLASCFGMSCGKGAAQYHAQLKKTVPNVLDYDAELVMDGRKAVRGPVN